LSRAFSTNPEQTRPLAQPAVAPGGVRLDQADRKKNADQNQQQRRKSEARLQIAPKLPEFMHGELPQQKAL
jgi:hypothetical protein